MANIGRNSGQRLRKATGRYFRAKLKELRMRSSYSWEKLDVLLDLSAARYYFGNRAPQIDDLARKANHIGALLGQPAFRLEACGIAAIFRSPGDYFERNHQIPQDAKYVFDASNIEFGAVRSCAQGWRSLKGNLKDLAAEEILILEVYDFPDPEDEPDTYFEHFCESDNSAGKSFPTP